MGFITFLNVILNDIGSETNWAIFEWSKYVSKNDVKEHFL